MAQGWVCKKENADVLYEFDYPYQCFSINNGFINWTDYSSTWCSELSQNSDDIPCNVAGCCEYFYSEDVENINPIIGIQQANEEQGGISDEYYICCFGGTLETFGCMDSDAINYDPNATFDTEATPLNPNAGCIYAYSEEEVLITATDSNNTYTESFSVSVVDWEDNPFINDFEVGIVEGESVYINLFDALDAPTNELPLCNYEQWWDCLSFHILEKAPTPSNNPGYLWISDLVWELDEPSPTVPYPPFNDDLGVLHLCPSGYDPPCRGNLYFSPYSLEQPTVDIETLTAGISPTTLEYRPDSNVTGNDYFYYAVKDLGTGLVTIGRVKINILGTGDMFSINKDAIPPTQVAGMNPRGMINFDMFAGVLNDGTQWGVVYDPDFLYDNFCVGTLDGNEFTYCNNTGYCADNATECFFEGEDAGSNNSNCLGITGECKCYDIDEDEYPLDSEECLEADALGIDGVGIICDESCHYTFNKEGLINYGYKIKFQGDGVNILAPRERQSGVKIQGLESDFNILKNGITSNPDREFTVVGYRDIDNKCCTPYVNDVYNPSCTYAMQTRFKLNHLWKPNKNELSLNNQMMVGGTRPTIWQRVENGTETGIYYYDKVTNYDRQHKHALNIVWSGDCTMWDTTLYGEECVEGSNNASLTLHDSPDLFTQTGEILFFHFDYKIEYGNVVANLAVYPNGFMNPTSGTLEATDLNLCSANNGYLPLDYLPNIQGNSTSYCYDKDMGYGWRRATIKIEVDSSGGMIHPALSFRAVSGNGVNAQENSIWETTHQGSTAASTQPYSILIDNFKLEKGNNIHGPTEYTENYNPSPLIEGYYQEYLLDVNILNSPHQFCPNDQMLKVPELGVGGGYFDIKFAEQDGYIDVNVDLNRRIQDKVPVVPIIPGIQRTEGHHDFGYIEGLVLETSPGPWTPGQEDALDSAVESTDDYSATLFDWWIKEANVSWDLFQGQFSRVDRGTVFIMGCESGFSIMAPVFKSKYGNEFYFSGTVSDMFGHRLRPGGSQLNNYYDGSVAYGNIYGASFGDNLEAQDHHTNSGKPKGSPIRSDNGVLGFKTGEQVGLFWYSGVATGDSTYSCYDCLDYILNSSHLSPQPGNISFDQHAWSPDINLADSGGGGGEFGNVGVTEDGDEAGGQIGTDQMFGGFGKDAAGRWTPFGVSCASTENFENPWRNTEINYSNANLPGAPIWNIPVKVKDPGFYYGGLDTVTDNDSIDVSGKLNFISNKTSTEYSINADLHFIMGYLEYFNNTTEEDLINIFLQTIGFDINNSDKCQDGWCDNSTEAYDYVVPESFRTIDMGINNMMVSDQGWYHIGSTVFETDEYYYLGLNDDAVIVDNINYPNGGIPFFVDNLQQRDTTVNLYISEPLNNYIVDENIREGISYSINSTFTSDSEFKNMDSSEGNYLQMDVSTNSAMGSVLSLEVLEEYEIADETIDFNGNYKLAPNTDYLWSYHFYIPSSSYRDFINALNPNMENNWYTTNPDDINGLMMTPNIKQCKSGTIGTPDCQGVVPANVFPVGDSCYDSECYQTNTEEGGNNWDLPSDYLYSSSGWDSDFYNSLYIRKAPFDYQQYGWRRFGIASRVNPHYDEENYAEWYENRYVHYTLDIPFGRFVLINLFDGGNDFKNFWSLSPIDSINGAAEGEMLTVNDEDENKKDSFIDSFSTVSNYQVTSYDSTLIRKTNSGTSPNTDLLTLSTEVDAKWLKVKLKDNGATWEDYNGKVYFYLWVRVKPQNPDDPNNYEELVSFEDDNLGLKLSILDDMSNEIATTQITDGDGNCVDSFNESSGMIVEDCFNGWVSIVVQADWSSINSNPVVQLSGIGDKGVYVDRPRIDVDRLPDGEIISIDDFGTGLKSNSDYMGYPYYSTVDKDIWDEIPNMGDKIKDFQPETYGWVKHYAPIPTLVVGDSQSFTAPAKELFPGLTAFDGKPSCIFESTEDYCTGITPELDGESFKIYFYGAQVEQASSNLTPLGYDDDINLIRSVDIPIQVTGINPPKFKTIIYNDFLDLDTSSNQYGIQNNEFSHANTIPYDEWQVIVGNLSAVGWSALDDVAFYPSQNIYSDEYLTIQNPINQSQVNVDPTFGVFAIGSIDFSTWIYNGDQSGIQISLITDNGEVIPISEEFEHTNEDIWNSVVTAINNGPANSTPLYRATLEDNSNGNPNSNLKTVIIEAVNAGKEYNGALNWNVMGNNLGTRVLGEENVPASPTFNDLVKGEAYPVIHLYEDFSEIILTTIASDVDSNEILDVVAFPDNRNIISASVEDKYVYHKDADGNIVEGPHPYGESTLVGGTSDVPDFTDEGPGTFNDLAVTFGETRVKSSVKLTAQHPNCWQDIDGNWSAECVYESDGDLMQPNFVGDINVTLKVRDNALTADTKYFKIRVHPVNDPPLIDALSDTKVFVNNANYPTDINVELTAWDIENDTVEFKDVDAVNQSYCTEIEEANLAIREVEEFSEDVSTIECIAYGREICRPSEDSYDEELCASDNWSEYTCSFADFNGDGTIDDSDYNDCNLITTNPNFVDMKSVSLTDTPNWINPSKLSSFEDTIGSFRTYAHIVPEEDKIGTGSIRISAQDTGLSEDGTLTVARTGFTTMKIEVGGISIDGPQGNLLSLEEASLGAAPDTYTYSAKGEDEREKIPTTLSKDFEIVVYPYHPLANYDEGYVMIECGNIPYYNDPGKLNKHGECCSVEPITLDYKSYFNLNKEKWYREEFVDELYLFARYFKSDLPMGKYCDSGVALDKVTFTYDNKFDSDNMGGFLAPNSYLNKLDYVVWYEIEIRDIVENYQTPPDDTIYMIDGNPWWQYYFETEEDYIEEWNNLELEGWDFDVDAEDNNPNANRLLFRAGPFTQENDNLEKIIIDGFTYKYNYPSFYNVAISSSDSYGYVNINNTIIDGTSIVKLQQSLLEQYSPWQGMNITGSEEVNNSYFHMLSRDKDNRPSLGCFYYSEINNWSEWFTKYGYSYQTIEDPEINPGGWTANYTGEYYPGEAINYIQNSELFDNLKVSLNKNNLVANGLKEEDYPLLDECVKLHSNLFIADDAVSIAMRKAACEKIILNNPEYTSVMADDMTEDLTEAINISRKIYQRYELSTETWEETSTTELNFGGWLGWLWGIVYGALPPLTTTQYFSHDYSVTSFDKWIYGGRNWNQDTTGNEALEVHHYMAPVSGISMLSTDEEAPNGSNTAYKIYQPAGIEGFSNYWMCNYDYYDTYTDTNGTWVHPYDYIEGFPMYQVVSNYDDCAANCVARVSSMCALDPVTPTEQVCEDWDFQWWLLLGGPVWWLGGLISDSFWVCGEWATLERWMCGKTSNSNVYRNREDCQEECYTYEGTCSGAISEYDSQLCEDSGFDWTFTNHCETVGTVGYTKNHSGDRIYYNYNLAQRKLITGTDTDWVFSVFIKNPDTANNNINPVITFEATPYTVEGSNYQSKTTLLFNSFDTGFGLDEWDLVYNMEEYPSATPSMMFGCDSATGEYACNNSCTLNSGYNPWGQTETFPYASEGFMGNYRVYADESNDRFCNPDQPMIWGYDVGDGWHRVFLRIQGESINEELTVNIYPAGIDSNTISSGELLVWGAQIEQLNPYEGGNITLPYQKTRDVGEVGVYDFIPDVDVRSPLSVDGAKSVMIRYYDDELQPEQYDETAGPVEAQLYFYIRDPFEEELFKPKSVIDYIPETLYIGFLDWGDGSKIEYTDEPYQLKHSGNLTHNYIKSGVYEIRGEMFNIALSSLGYSLGIGEFREFLVRININSDFEIEQEFKTLGGKPTYIPYPPHTTAGIIGGISDYSAYAKLIKRYAGYIGAGDIKYDLEYRYWGDEFKNEMALAKVNEDFVGPLVSAFTGSYANEPYHGIIDTDLVGIYNTNSGMPASQGPRGFYSGSWDSATGWITGSLANPPQLINRGVGTNFGELGDYTGDIDLGQFRYYQNGTFTMAKQLGFVDELADNPMSEKYYKNIIPAGWNDYGYNALNTWREGVYHNLNCSYAYMTMGRYDDPMEWWKFDLYCSDEEKWNPAYLRPIPAVDDGTWPIEYCRDEVNMFVPGICIDIYDSQIWGRDLGMRSSMFYTGCGGTVDICGTGGGPYTMPFEGEEGYFPYYPVLPKLDKFGKYNELMGLQGTLEPTALQNTGYLGNIDKNNLLYAGPHPAVESPFRTAINAPYTFSMWLQILSDSISVDAVGNVALIITVGTGVFYFRHFDDSYYMHLLLGNSSFESYGDGPVNGALMVTYYKWSSTQVNPYYEYLPTANLIPDGPLPEMLDVPVHFIFDSDVFDVESILNQSWFHFAFTGEPVLSVPDNTDEEERDSQGAQYDEDILFDLRINGQSPTHIVAGQQDSQWNGKVEIPHTNHYLDYNTIFAEGQGFSDVLDDYMLHSINIDDIAIFNRIVDDSELRNTNSNTPLDLMKEHVENVHDPNLRGGLLHYWKPGDSQYDGIPSNAIGNETYNAMEMPVIIDEITYNTDTTDIPLAPNGANLIARQVTLNSSNPKMYIDNNLLYGDAAPLQSEGLLLNNLFVGVTYKMTIAVLANGNTSGETKTLGINVNGDWGHLCTDAGYTNDGFHNDCKLFSEAGIPIEPNNGHIEFDIYIIPSTPVYESGAPGPVGADYVTESYGMYITTTESISEGELEFYIIDINKIPGRNFLMMYSDHIYPHYFPEYSPKNMIQSGVGTGGIFVDSEQRLPFGSPNRKWNEIDTGAVATSPLSKELHPTFFDACILDINLSNNEDGILGDISGHSNMGIILSDYVVEFDTRTLEPKSTENSVVASIGTDLKRKSY